MKASQCYTKTLGEAAFRNSLCNPLKSCGLSLFIIRGMLLLQVIGKQVARLLLAIRREPPHLLIRSMIRIVNVIALDLVRAVTCPCFLSCYCWVKVATSRMYLRCLPLRSCLVFLQI